MPDSFEHTSVITTRMPNGALASLAGNVDPHHEVSIADLILVHGRVRATIERLIESLQPDVVGLSVMTFQRRTAQRVAALVRELRPSATIVVGGYDPSLAMEVYEDPAWGADVIVRGEGDVTFRELMQGPGGRDAAVGGGRPLLPRGRPVPADGATRGQLARRRRGAAAQAFCAGADRLHLSRPPDRCGRNVARLHLRLQLLLDHRDARAELPHVVDRARRWTTSGDARTRGARAIFLVDDNITLNVRAVRGAVPRDRRQRPQRHRLPRPGDDVVHRVSRRDAGAADARSGIPLRLPRHREHPGRRPRVPAREREERCAREGTPGRQRHRGGDRRPASPQDVRGRRPDRRQPDGHARVDRGESRVRAAPRSTGRTSSIRRRIPGRR